MTHRFRIEDMTCGHCVARVTKAVRGADPDASVDIDLSSRVALIDGRGERDDYAAAIRDAGYTPFDAD